MAAAVIEQFRVARPLKRALAHDQQQDVDGALPEVLLNTVQAQAQLALGG